jgi:hypothetical protein
MLGTDHLVRKAVMPIYTDSIGTEKNWKKNIQFKEFQENKKEMEIGQENKRHDSKQSTNRNKQKVAKMVRLPASRYEKGEPIYETYLLQDGKYSNF